MNLGGTSGDIPPRRLAGLVAAVGVVVVTVLLARACLHPLAGYDTPWRWDHLARMMLRHGNLDFYPPMTAADYEVYPYADGIAPLVAAAYWGVYRVFGSDTAALTTLVVAIQVLGCLWLVANAAKRLWGEGSAGWSAAGLLALTPLWCRGAAIGQETGLTAIAVAGQIWCVLAARKGPAGSWMVCAGLFAGMAALAREYGVALSVVGFGLAFQQATTRRFIILFFSIMLVLAGPWYLRNWQLCGNPLFAMPSIFGPAANPVHAAIMRFYAGNYAISAAPVEKIGEILAGLIAGGLPLLVLGVIAAWRQRRQQWPLVLGAGVSGLLWLWSVQYTAGGVGYSMRVLTPLWVCLAVLAGGLVPGIAAWFWRAGSGSRATATLGFTVWACWCLATAAAFPWPATHVLSAWREMSLRPIDRAIDPRLFVALEASPAPPLGILTDDPYFAAALIQRSSRFRPVMVWSPAVAMLFDPKASVAECNRLLGRLETPLVYPLRNFQNWPFLMRYPFFRHESGSWERWIGVGERGVEIMPHVMPPEAFAGGAVHQRPRSHEPSRGERP